MFGHFTCIYVCASHVCLVLIGARWKCVSGIKLLPAYWSIACPHCFSRVVTWHEGPDSPVECLVEWRKGQGKQQWEERRLETNWRSADVPGKWGFLHLTKPFNPPADFIAVAGSDVDREGQSGGMESLLKSPLQWVRQTVRAVAVRLGRREHIYSWHSCRGSCWILTCPRTACLLLPVLCCGHRWPSWNFMAKF